jgi:hydrogenase maturation protease
MKIIVIGLGNSILTDDSVGIKISELLPQKLEQSTFPESVEIAVEQNEAGGWDILDQVTGFDTLILIDAISDTSLAPGEVSWYSDKIFSSARLSGVHTMDVFSAVEYGRKYHLKVPDTLLILGVGVKDIHTFGETCTQEVEPAIEKGAEAVLEKIRELVGTC